ncbi:hypothetical protein [Aliivibrio logei]|uniref:Uncharacterized protein n=1 Tax=Aliivibrio logei TaxID=688 RepID=A0A1B9NWY1_ALILO|nr:hypothetical protein [Aliivibrio logei]OCH19962.1 hypothetical protein A6E04_15520 [Aliivibrio logei]
MGDENDDVMAPMVDALTGAMAAILLVTIFLMLNTISSVSDSVKEYGKNALYKNEELINDVFKREPPTLILKENRVYFFKSYKLSEKQISLIKEEFKNKQPNKLIIYSNNEEDIVTYNTLLFIQATGLSKNLENLNIIYLPSRNGNITEFVWE